MVRVLLLVLALGACAPSDAEIKTARSAVYQADGEQIFQLAEQGAMDENYKIATVDDGHLTFETLGRFYSPTGDLQSEGADSYVKIDNHSVKVSFIVVVQQIGTNQYAIQVTPRTWQYLAGSPQMRELTVDDPSLPPWVHGRADHLALAIYDRTKGFAVAAPAAPAPATRP
jgi:hypothetical protein